jgi:drug/metabolite transporter (DMT)-like permease
VPERRLGPAPDADPRLAELGVLAVVVIWAGNFISVKFGITEVPPLVFAFVRTLTAGIFLLAVLRWREGSVALPRRDIVPLALLGFVGFGLYQALWTTSLTGTSVGNSALMLAVSPIITAFVAVAVGSDTLTPAKILGAALSVIGAGLVITAGRGVGLDDGTASDLLALGAAGCWAIYVSLGANVLARHSPLRTTAWTVFFGSLSLLPFGLLQVGAPTPDPFGPVGLVAILYSGMLSTGVGNVFIFRGVQVVGPTRVAIMYTLVPAFVLVFGAIFLGEAIHLEQVIGGAVILTGVAVARRGPLPPGRAIAVPSSR